MGRRPAKGAPDAPLLGRARRRVIDLEDVRVTKFRTNRYVRLVEARAEEHHLGGAGSELLAEHLVDVLRPCLTVKEHPFGPPFEFLDEAVADSRQEDEAEDILDEADRHMVGAAAGFGSFWIAP